MAKYKPESYVKGTSKKKSEVVYRKSEQPDNLMKFLLTIMQDVFMVGLNSPRYYTTVIHELLRALHRESVYWGKMVAEALRKEIDTSRDLMKSSGTQEHIFNMGPTLVIFLRYYREHLYGETFLEEDDTWAPLELPDLDLLGKFARSFQDLAYTRRQCLLHPPLVV